MNKPLTPNDPTHPLWAQYAKARGRDKIKIRNQLVLAFMPMLAGRAEVMAKKNPYCSAEEFQQYGFFGLLNAIEHFQPGRGLKFSSYASPKIRGAILDGIRELDWIPRLVRHRAAILSAAHAVLLARLGRPPMDQEMARELGAQQFALLAAEQQAVDLQSLQKRIGENESGSPQTMLDVTPAENAGELSQDLEDRDGLDELLRGFSREEKLIVHLYYSAGLVMRQIGEAVGMSESRVSQIHSSIIARLRTMPDKAQGILEKSSSKPPARP